MNITVEKIFKTDSGKVFKVDTDVSVRYHNGQVYEGTIADFHTHGDHGGYLVLEPYKHDDARLVLVFEYIESIRHLHKNHVEYIQETEDEASARINNFGRELLLKDIAFANSYHSMHENNLPATADIMKEVVCDDSDYSRFAWVLKRLKNKSIRLMWSSHLSTNLLQLLDEYDSDEQTLE